MASKDRSSEVTSSLSKLTLGGPKKSGKGGKAFKSKEPVLDSWEDEEIDSDSNSDSGKAGADSSSGAKGTPVSRDDDERPKAPPPTPISPLNIPSNQPWIPSDPTSFGANNASHPLPDRRRPEKTDAVARRMIASALGVKAPRMTEEQKAYDKSVKERERKRREQEKAAEVTKREEAEKAKAAIWDD